MDCVANVFLSRQLFPVYMNERAYIWSEDQLPDYTFLADYTIVKCTKKNGDKVRGMENRT